MKKFSWYVLLLIATICFTGQIRAQNNQATAKVFFWRQCTENVIMLYVDSKPFEEFVGKDFSVKLYDGKAWVMIVLQNCQNNFFDGEDIGTAQEVHMWVSVEGPRDNETLPVFGAEKTLNTMSWFYLFNGSTNLKARKYYSKSGIISDSIENLSLSLTSTQLSGRLVINPSMNFAWKAVPKEPPFNKIGVNFDIFRRDSLGNVVFSQVQALLMVKSWFAPGTLEVMGGADPNKLIGPGTYQVFINSYNPILVRALLGIATPK
jgi:hypothetical protein